MKDATADVATVDLWWSTWPDANIGLACGAASGIVVVDIDQRHGGYVSLEEWESQRGEPLPETLIALSGGGGRHLFFKYPGDAMPVPNRNGWLSGVDVRSDGGYVILPPGTHISGGTYTWLNLGTLVAQAPIDLLQAIRAGAGGSTRGDLPDTASILEGIGEGQRDDVLFRWACRLRRQLGDNREAVEILVLEAARKAKPPFPENEARAKVEQAFKQNHDDDPFTWSFVNEEGEPIRSATDLGNALRFVDHHVDTVRYVPQWGWLQWTDIGWVRCGTEDVNFMARSVPDIIRADAKSLMQDNPTMSTALLRWSRQSESAGKLSAVESLARDDVRIRRDVDEFDADDFVIGCRNGIVDLRTGDVREVSRDDLVTKNTNVVYDPDFELPAWNAFLEEATQGDTEVMAYLQRAAGYTLTGSNAEECFFVISGPPASGKSTFLDALLGALGGYGTTTQSDTFMYRRGQSGDKNELARLAGVRLVSVSEIREGELFNESLVKQFTGGDRVTARFLYRDTFEFRPQLKLWIGTNHDPDARDDAMWRRVKKVTFSKTIPVDRRDPALKAMLRDPDVGGKAVLAWAARGAMEWVKHGLVEPVAVTAAVHDYRAEQDRMGQFIEETMNIVPGEAVGVQALYTTYNIWCKMNNERPLRTPQFVNAMKARGLGVIKHEVDRKRYFTGAQAKAMHATENGVTWQ